MRILVLGSGARENAIAWSLEWGAGSQHDDVFVGPGNGGSTRRLNVDPCNVVEVVSMCQQHRIDFVVVGPETALAVGVVDALEKANIAVFGPTKAAARLETSKGYCREFANRYAIPSPQSAQFAGDNAVTAAREWADAQSFELVVKADGLAGGKGVVVPETINERNDAIVTLAKAGPIVLEERLVGTEVSVLVFTDGVTVRAMPPACDHKRIGEGDIGLNTGGMGVVAPTSTCSPEMVDQIVAQLIQPAIDGLRQEGIRYVGVLYAGVMLTDAGPKLIEFNCRFGDPEAEALLPLLDTDLKQILVACVEGRLGEIDLKWTDKTSCTVVIASDGYPAAPNGREMIYGVEHATGVDGVFVFHAGTQNEQGQLFTNGGRVFAVTAVGSNLLDARNRAYEAASHIEFAGKVIRRDIGWREIARNTGGYSASGVNIDEGNRAVGLMKKKVEATHTKDVLTGVGAFGGSLSVARLLKMKEPVLVASTDGVGTKVMLAAEMNRYDTIGHDIVNHCVNDVLVQRAEPLFFLDYFASSKISAEFVAEVVSGMADACLENECVLLGGETAEMPGVYTPGHFDVAGTIVGVVERERLLPNSHIQPGDVLLGLASSGLHTNGYSLARRIFAGLPLDVTPLGLNKSLGEALLVPHRSYLHVLRAVLATDFIKGLVHVTGGGFQENIPRILPDECSAHVRLGSWPMPPLFQLLKDASELDDHELYRTFNMGIGMILVVDKSHVEQVKSLVAEETWYIGNIVKGFKEVLLT